VLAFCIFFPPKAGVNELLNSPSALRKLHDSVADPKYSGVRTTRQHLAEDSDIEVDRQPFDQSNEDGEDGSIPSDSSREDDRETKVPPPQSHVLPAQPAQTDQEPVNDLSTTLRTTREEDRKKGKAVSRQLVCVVIKIMNYAVPLSLLP
jgi:protein AATF/BFR2